MVLNRLLSPIKRTVGSTSLGRANLVIFVLPSCIVLMASMTAWAQPIKSAQTTRPQAAQVPEHDLGTAQVSEQGTSSGADDSQASPQVSTGLAIVSQYAANPRPNSSTRSALTLPRSTGNIPQQSADSVRAVEPQSPQLAKSSEQRSNAGQVPAKTVSLDLGSQSTSLRLQPAVAVAEPHVDSLPIEAAQIVPASSLSGNDVGCKAACCWPLSKLLEERARTLLIDGQRFHLTTSQCEAKVQATFLRRQAAWQRDVAAATALKAYYAWLANREQLAILKEALELQSNQARVQAALIARQAGIEDPTALERKRLQLQDQLLQAQLADRQLAANVMRLTCCQVDPTQVSVEALEIQPQEFACDCLVQYALTHRQDYLAVEQLCQCVEEDTARSIAQLLSPLTGVGLDVLNLDLIEGLCWKLRGDDLVCQVRKEIKHASHLLRLRIEQSVCDRCHELSVAYQRMAVAQQVIQSWESRIAALQRMEELGDARGQAMATAKAELLAAHSTFITRKLAARTTEVELAEAIGGLAVRCCQGQAWLVIEGH